MQRYGSRGAGENGIATNHCWRRDAGILEKVARPVPRREHVVRQMEFVVIPAVVLPEENLDSTPRALDGIRVCAGVSIDEVDAVVDGAMRVNLRTEIAVRTPAITNDRSAGSIQSQMMSISVLAVLSLTETRNVSPDSRSTPSNTH